MNGMKPTSGVNGCSSSLVTAPIALFVYNRPDHTRETVEYLRHNELAPQSDIYIFSDGPKNAAAMGKVATVRNYLESIDGFRSVSIVERDHNYGLAKSIIDGVTQVCEQFGRAIIMEDDLLSAPDFLTFVNRALVKYEASESVFSVTGFNYALSVPSEYPFDAFLTSRCSSWGWATWKNRWRQADWEMNDFERFMRSREQRRSFNRGGNDLTRMLAMQMRGEIDSWAIRWAYTHFKHDALALYPVHSRIVNVGFDGTGVHCRVSRIPQAQLSSTGTAEYRFPDHIQGNAYFSKQIRDLHAVSLARRFAPRWAKDAALWLLKKRKSTIPGSVQIT